MSQFQPPYTPPSQPYPYGYPYSDPYAPLRAPAKRASLLMFIFGGLLFTCGLCCAGFSQLVPWDRLPAEQLAQLQQAESQLGFSVRILFLIVSLFSILPGIIQLLLGFFVRRNSFIGTIIAIITTSIGILFCLLSIVGTFADLARNSARAVDALLGSCMVFLVLALLVLQLFWLIQAARAIPQLRNAQAQYQQQYWQYYQNQQLYTQPQPPLPPPGDTPTQLPPTTPPPPPPQA